MDSLLLDTVVEGKLLPVLLDTVPVVAPVLLVVGGLLLDTVALGSLLLDTVVEGRLLPVLLDTVPVVAPVLLVEGSLLPVLLGTLHQTVADGS